MYYLSMVNNQVATLGGGCYWCLDAFYRLVNGITNVMSGYSGGQLEHPTALQVYAGNTGHAEVVQFKFDPTIISFEEILKIFFVMHDPTTLNRQGNDVGEHYRSVIFYHDDTQKDIAEKLKNGFASELWKKPVVTEITQYDKFWPATPEDQDFYAKNPIQPYCQVIIAPKIQKLRQEFAKYIKTS